MNISTVYPPNALIGCACHDCIAGFVIRRAVSGCGCVRLGSCLLNTVDLISDIVSVRFPPRGCVQVKASPGISRGLPFKIVSSHLVFHLGIVHPFVGVIRVPERIVFAICIASAPGSPLIAPICAVDFNNQIRMPRGYRLGTKRVIRFSFNSVNTSLFDTTKPKGQPTNIVPRAGDVTIGYAGITTRTCLAVHLRTDTISNRTVISSGRSLNFVITSRGSAPVAPGSLGDIVPFHLSTTTTTGIALHT